MPNQDLEPRVGAIEGIDHKWTPEKAVCALAEYLAKLRDARVRYPWRVLVVDDDENDRQFLENALIPYGCEVKACANQGDAEKLAASGLFDVVFLDLRLPPGDGLEVLKKVKAIRPDQRFVIVTGFYPEGSGLRTQALELGAALCMNKPVTKTDLDNIFGSMKGA